MENTTIAIAVCVGAALVGVGYLIARLTRKTPDSVSLHLHTHSTGDIGSHDDCDVCDTCDDHDSEQ